MTPQPLTHALLSGCGVTHGFGVRGAPVPAGILRPRQVHGADIATDAECEGPTPPAADGIVSRTPGRPVAIVTADCVPVLLATADGTTVAAVHAGWRGLAAGVVAAGVAAVRGRAAAGATLVAVIGPHIGACCYEVDAPVVDALHEHLGGAVDRRFQSSRAGHGNLDLGGLVRDALGAAGLDGAAIAVLPEVCTRCDSQRFHSYRRDGERAGRLIHFICARSPQA